MVSAEFRNAGRPDWRKVFTADGFEIGRTYGYHGEKSLMNAFTVTAGGLTIGGSEIAHDGLQVASAKLLGVSDGKRTTQFSYDQRSLVKESIFGKLDLDPVVPPSLYIAGAASEELSPADFRAGQQRTPTLPNPPLGVDTWGRQMGQGFKLQCLVVVGGWWWGQTFTSLPRWPDGCCGSWR